MQNIKHLYFIGLITSMGMLITGCGKIPPVPEKETLRKMSFEAFMEHQRYHTYESVKPDYVAEGSMNTKLSNARENVYSYLAGRRDGLTQYCNAVGGTIQSRDTFRDSLFPKTSQNKLDWLAAEKRLSARIPSWNDFSSYCVVNNKPYFSFEVKEPYVEYTRVDNAWWTAQVKVRKITSLENLSDATPFLSQQELTNIQSDALAMDEQNTQRQKRNDEIEKRKNEQKEQELNSLRNRKGSNVMTFFDNYHCYDNTIADGHALDMRIAVHNSVTKALSFTPAMCQSICLEKNEKDTGYKELQKALNDRWSFVSKLGAKESKEGNCVCTGFQYVLQK